MVANCVSSLKKQTCFVGYKPRNLCSKVIKIRMWILFFLTIWFGFDDDQLLSEYQSAVELVSSPPETLQAGFRNNRGCIQNINWRPRSARDNLLSETVFKFLLGPVFLQMAEDGRRLK